MHLHLEFSPPEMFLFQLFLCLLLILQAQPPKRLSLTPQILAEFAWPHFHLTHQFLASFYFSPRQSFPLGGCSFVFYLPYRMHILKGKILSIYH